jgi:hypothetical protein
VVLAALAFAPKLALYGPVLDGWRLSCRLVLIVVACAPGVALVAYALAAEGDYPGAILAGRSAMIATVY